MKSNLYSIWIQGHTLIYQDYAQKEQQERFIIPIKEKGQEDGASCKRCRIACSSSTSIILLTFNIMYKNLIYFNHKWSCDKVSCGDWLRLTNNPHIR